MTARRRERRPLLAAAIVSLVLHGGLLLWVAMRPPPKALSPTPETIELVEIDLTSEPELPPAPEPVPPPAPSVERPRERRREPPRPTASLPSPETEVDQPPGIDAPFAPLEARAEPVPLRPALSPRADLALRVDLTLDAGVPEPEPGGLRGLDAKDGEQLVRELTAETIGRGKVERGLVHEWYRELGKALLKSWDAERAVSRRGLSGYLDQSVENGRAYQGIWMEHAAKYAATGNPLQEHEGDSPADDGRVPGSVSPTLQARRALKSQMRAEFRATKKATVRVVQDAEGRLLSAELVSPSNDPQVDKEALIDVRGAAENLPRPPAEVVAGKNRLVSLWQFELVVSITPPVPTMRFEFDEALGFVDTRLPLDRRIYKRVRLIQVD